MCSHHDVQCGTDITVLMSGLVFVSRGIFCYVCTTGMLEVCVCVCVCVQMATEEQIQAVRSGRELSSMEKIPNPSVPLPAHLAFVSVSISLTLASMYNVRTCTCHVHTYMYV